MDGCTIYAHTLFGIHLRQHHMIASFNSQCVMNCKRQPRDIEEEKDGWMDVRFMLTHCLVFIFVNIT